MELSPAPKPAQPTIAFGLFNMNRSGHYMERWLDDLKYTAANKNAAK